MLVAPISTSSRGNDARDDHDPEDKQVARGQGARNRGTGRDEHPRPEKMTVPIAVKRQEQLEPASPSTAAKDKFQDARTTSEPQRCCRTR